MNLYKYMIKRKQAKDPIFEAKFEILWINVKQNKTVWTGKRKLVSNKNTNAEYYFVRYTPKELIRLLVLSRKNTYAISIKEKQMEIK